MRIGESPPLAGQPITIRRGDLRCAVASQIVEITVKLFAVLRERAGASEVTLELPEGARVRDAIDSLASVTAGVPVVMAVNREYVPPDRSLAEGDELALIPPVSGGGDLRRIHAAVSGEPLSLERVSALVGRPAAGAIVSFQGTTRDVERLEYEAYAPLAIAEGTRILEEARTRFAVTKLACVHRVGSLAIGDVAVEPLQAIARARGQRLKRRRHPGAREVQRRHAGAGLEQRLDPNRAEPAERPRDHRDLIVESEPLAHERASSAFSGLLSTSYERKSSS